MKFKNIFLIFTFITILFTFVNCNVKSDTDFKTEEIKVVLRAVGHDLLLQHKDSTSLVLPIKKLEENKYELSFQKQLEINPDGLLKNIFKNFKNTNLPKNYIIEVRNCLTSEVMYSYQIKTAKEKNIIPCRGRNLPLDCYIIQVIFEKNIKKKTAFLWLLPIILIGLLLLRKRKITKESSKNKDYIPLGKYHFYENQNSLIIRDITINLTKKECEIISILSENKNQVVKRELLVKEVWEDNGVIVGRSLDAFISKLRKKFEHDNNVNIVNVHGVGYKLEVR